MVGSKAYRKPLLPELVEGLVFYCSGRGFVVG